MSDKLVKSLLTLASNTCELGIASILPYTSSRLSRRGKKSCNLSTSYTLSKIWECIFRILQVQKDRLPAYPMEVKREFWLMAQISPRFPSGRVDMGENDEEECMVTSI